MRFLIYFVLCLMPALTQAACSGEDLRRGISPQIKTRLEQEVAKVSFAQGNHWIAHRGDQRIHIVGTMHLGDGRMHRVMRQLRPLILASDLVFLEQVTVNTSQDPQDTIRANQHHFVMPRGKRLDQMLNPEDWGAIQKQAAHMGIGPKIAPFIQPWVYSLRLRSSDCGPRGLTGRHGLDERIQRFSLKRGIPIAGLEPANEGLRAFSGHPLKDQLRLLELNLNLARSFSDNDFAVTRREAYFDENLTEGWILTNWLYTQAAGTNAAVLRRLDAQLHIRLLDHRNKAWMPVLRSRKEKNILIAVGAAHLPGRYGILTLLQRQGYKLKPAVFR